MTTPHFIIFNLLMGAGISGLFFIYPRIARRGLLFGVYVGEERWDKEEARQIVRSWERGIILWTLLSFVVTLASFFRFHSPAILPILPLLLSAGCLALYLRAYFQARALGVAGRPLAVAVLTEPEAPSSWPFFTLVLCVIGGVVALSYAAGHYADLPARVPTHFGPSGRPDVWRQKSFWTVMLEPIMTLVMGVGLSILTFFIARAKRAIRFAQTRISIEAQQRFRTAVTRFFCGLAVSVTAMLSLMSIGSIRVGLGRAESLFPIVMILALCLGIGVFCGILYLAFRYGQGGARLERAASNAPLTDGLADNSRWVLGMFYINRDDPSIFVERRFGFGYTINLGNWKAVALIVCFVGALLVLALLGAVKK